MENEKPVRDSGGKFVRGHPLLNPKSETTGRFTRKPRAEDTIILKIPQDEPVEVIDPTLTEPVLPESEPVKEEPKKEPMVIKPYRQLRRWDESL